MSNWMLVPAQNDILHFGVKGKSGRYPWGSGDRPYQRLERRAGRVEKRMYKTAAQRDAAQNVANKKFKKAEDKTYRRFSTRKSVRKAMDQAYVAQRKASRYNVKGSKQYDKLRKILDRIGDLKLNPKTKALGDEFIKRVMENSEALYNQMLYENIKKR